MVLVVTKTLLEQVRHDAGLTQQELAERAGTSRTTLSAYERGRKAPNLATLNRLLDTVGYELAAEVCPTFHEVERLRGRPIFVADRLWRLPIAQAFAAVTLPFALS